MIVAILRGLTACAGAMFLFVAGTDPVNAQSVHRCRLADGSYGYQDRPCNADQDAGIHVIRATQAGEVPPGVKAEREFVAANRAPQQPSAASFFEAAPITPTPTRDNRGYRCTAGKRVFYQMEPCPKLGFDGEYTRYTGYTGREEHIGTVTRYETATVQLPHMRETEQKEITRMQACEGQRAELDPYTRYTTSNPCHPNR